MSNGTASATDDRFTGCTDASAHDRMHFGPEAHEQLGTTTDAVGRSPAWKKERIGLVFAAALVASAGALLASGPQTPSVSSPAHEALRSDSSVGAAVPGAPSRVADERLIKLDGIRRLHVTSLGRVLEDRYVPFTPTGGGSGGDGDTYGPQCQTLSSHTDANFSGGTYRVQAGMVNGEAFAATYTLPASAFPIRIDLAEVIFATSGAVIPTTTEWSVLFYSGTPTSGSLVHTSSSDDELLPHVRLAAGTNGVNLNFSVDPNDPDQIIIPAPTDGSNTFTMAFRIDRMQTPPGNPCLQPPDATRNAFMVTDVSGLAQPGATWLLGIDCGPFGCPANGGWARFSALPGFCRPSGDWVARVTWTRVNCQPGAGACCLPAGNCVILTEADCQAQNGTYRGDNTDCATANCPAPTGACCFSNGFCLTLTSADCAGSGGTWLGAGVACGTNNTCPTGACCLPLGTCVSGVTQAQCAAQSGTFRGVGSSCAGANCPQPQGACCLPNGFCLQVTEAECAGLPGASWSGAFTTCADGNGNGRADICEVDCPADFNNDGQADFFDYLDFANAFANDDPSADFNNDAQVDFFDYLDFASAFAEGCP